MKDIYLGLDLCEKNIQMSYYREDKQEPESIYQLNNSETYQIPNVMFYAEEEKRWYVGSDVSTVRFQTKGIIVDDIFANLDSEKHIVVDNCSYTYEMLLLLLLQTHIHSFLERSPEYRLCGVTICIEKYDKRVYGVLERLQKELAISNEHFYIMSRENAFYQYVMHQEEKLRTNSVAMFEYGNEGMEYYRVDKKQQGNAIIYNLIKKDMKQELPYGDLFKDVEVLDKRFADVARTEMRETYISTVYLTGPGFHDQWIEETTKVLCEGRRVFMGQNIYTKGACYHARFGAYEDGRDCVLITAGSIPYDIGIHVGEMEERFRFHPIALGGREWYNMKGKVTLFLDDTNRVEMVYRNKISKKEQKEIIEIHGLPKRPPKTTKLSLEVEMYDGRTGAIIIRDVGFGKLYPTTNKIYRRDFSIG